MERKLEKYKVIAVYKGKYKVSDEKNTFITSLIGNYMNRIECSSDFPTVGDYVLVDSFGYIVDLVERKNKLSRKSSGKKNDEQIISANIDYMFIVSSLNLEFNINKISSFIALAQTCNIIPVIVLTKADLCDCSDVYIDKINEIYSEIKIIVVCALNNVGVDKILKVLTVGKTGVFVGASGVGKSTLVNTLTNGNNMKTFEVKKTNDEGRHTTTHRELFTLDNGSYIIDTPGIRTVNLWCNENANIKYDEIEELSGKCLFSNCKHINEKGCAVIEAVNIGALSKEKYKNYVKMSRQLYYAKLENNNKERKKFKNKVKLQCKNERYNKKK